MTTKRQRASSALLGLALALALMGPASAQELPTGAARAVEKVQTRIFIEKSSLMIKVGQIEANIPPGFGGK
jgi:hypothetical protein